MPDENLTGHPDNALRVQGYDRILYPDGLIDLRMGEAAKIAAALEDNIFRGIWVTSIHGAQIFVILSKVESLALWRPESMAQQHGDDALYSTRPSWKQDAQDDD